MISKRLLVGYDGSAQAREAALMAARLAKKLQARVTVLTVGQPAAIGKGTTLAQFDESTISSIAEEGAEIVRGQGVIAERRIESGEPAQVLVEVAVREGHDLVVVGYVGLTLKDLFMGSVARKVATDAHCPVLIVRGTAPEVIARILVAVDGSEQAQRALVAAVMLGKPFDASFTLLYVIDELVWAVASRSPLRYGHRRTLEEIAMEVLADASQPCRKAGVTYNVVCAIGKPADAICRLAEDGDYDMASVGRHGRIGVTRLILGSVSEKVLRTAGPLVLVASERVVISYKPYSRSTWLFRPALNRRHGSF